MKPRQRESDKVMMTASGKNEIPSSISQADVQIKHHQSSTEFNTMNIKQQKQQSNPGNPNQLATTAVRSEFSIVLNNDCQASNEMMTTTTTTENKVSNLIGEMINDVSKTIKTTTKNNNNNNNTSTSLKIQSLIFNNEPGTVDDCIGDFPIKTAYTGAIADASKTILRSSRTGGVCDGILSSTQNPTTTTKTTCINSRRKISPAMLTKSATTTTTTATKNRITPTTIVTTTPIPIGTLTTTTTTSAVKKSFTLRKNKCPANEPHEISSPRALKANTTSASPIYGRINSTQAINNKWSQPKSIQCELLESSSAITACNKQSTIGSGSLSTGNRKNLKYQNTNLSKSYCKLSLAEGKAKLRSDFFKDILKDSTVEKTEFQEKEPQQQQKQQQVEIANQKLISPSILRRKSQSAFNLNSQQSYIVDIYDDDEGEDTDETIVLVPISAVSKLTLVERRKLELTRQFAAQTTVKKTARREKDSLNKFYNVADLINKFEMIVNPNKTVDMHDQNMLTLKPDGQDQRHNSPLSDEGCNLGQSPYSTDDEHDNNDDNETASIRSADTAIETNRCISKRKDKVARSASSDSALGLEVDDPMDATMTLQSNVGIPTAEQQQKRRMTLTVTDLPLRPALLPLAEPTTLPDSPIPEMQQTLQNLLAQTSVPTKVLLEERVVGIPEDSLLRTSAPGSTSLDNSRRESAQSCLSDYPFSDCGGIPGVRYVRTPSVVVSDYSDDVMCGITLEEIEYFRQQRLRRRSSLDTAGTEKDSDLPSDVSVASSCSNLYYCGSTISALDGSECLVNGVTVPLQRKISNCSSCSASGNEDDTTSTSSSAFTLTEDNTGTDIADLLAAQHLSSKRPKQVGSVSELDVSGKRF